MANEYLQRVPTSAGNRSVWTWSSWVKHDLISAPDRLFSCYASAGVQSAIQYGYRGGNNTTGALRLFNIPVSPISGIFELNNLLTDVGNWYHLLISLNTTLPTSSDRVKIYINSVLQPPFSSTFVAPSQDELYSFNSVAAHFIGSQSGTSEYFEGSLSDIFFVDGKAFTPEVFGFYKDGKGYISGGSTLATDFKNGQWVPRKPSNIIQEINDSGGFGVNGFYLPMNDSTNFGADFHCPPNTIITLRGETAAQPRNGAPSTTNNYVSQLRSDPFKDYLVLALPFVSGGTSNGFGDYSAAIKGSGTAKVGTVTGNVSITSIDSHYGSAVYFNGSSGNYFSIPDNNDFEFGSGDYTVEFWCNPSRSINFEEIISKGYPWQLYRNVSGQFAIALSANNSSYWVERTIGFGAVNQWHHIAISKSGSTTYAFLNGICTLVVTNSLSIFDGTSALFVGSYDPTTYPFQGYLQDLRVYKGVAKYTSGFDVPKPYAPVGISTWRAVPDNAQNNFAIWNILDAKSTTTLTDGNLTTGDTAGNNGVRATMAVSTGKWYWEFMPFGTIQNHHGVWEVDVEMSNLYVGQSTNSWGMYDTNGNKRHNGSFEPYGTGFNQYDVGMVALDKTNGKIYWGKNGVWFTDGDPVTGKNPGYSNLNTVNTVAPAQLQFRPCSYNFGQNPTFAGYLSAGTFTDSNGKGQFKYQPPEGFLALCEDNLPTPSIQNPGDYFKGVLYVGSGASRNITGVGFKPDFVWVKDRTSTSYNYLLHDSVRGVTSALRSSATVAESSGVLTSFDPDGFSITADLGINAAGNNHVAWCWKAGNQTITNTDGTLQSRISVSQTAGFSVVTWTGNGVTSATVGHGLGRTPALIITKKRTAGTDWFIKHKSLTSQHNLLFTSSGQSNVTSAFSNGGLADLTSATTFGFLNGSAGNSNNVNESTVTFIAYCWAEIEGFSKIGTYTGNANVNGPFVYCGFKPAWVMIKRVGGAADWVIHDSFRTPLNPSDNALRPNTADADLIGSTLNIDFVSNGFKIRNTNASYNNSEAYIYAAFAESPFKYANSK